MTLFEKIVMSDLVMGYHGFHNWFQLSDDPNTSDVIKGTYLNEILILDILLSSWCW